MKSTFLLLVPFAVATTLAPATETSLEFAPEEGVTLARTFEATLDMDLSAFKIVVDGEETRELELDWNIEWVETIAVEDVLESVGEGRPLEFVRTFSELKQESTISADDNEIDELSLSDLEGRSLRFEWDEDAEYYSVEADDDEDELDDETLEWLDEDMDLRAVLPEDPVEEGDSWEIDEAVYLPLMWPGGLLGFYSEEEEGVSDIARELNRGTIENLSGEGEATLLEIRDEDGTRVAVIEIELDIETEARATDDSGEDDGIPEITHSVEVSRELEGEILWDLDNDHLHSVDIQAEVTKIHSRAQVIDFADEEHEVEEREEYEGELEYVVTVERE